MHMDQGKALHHVCQGEGGAQHPKARVLLSLPRGLQFREAGARRCRGRHISAGVHVKERTVIRSGLMVVEAEVSRLL